jgi:hypothetical protein
VTRPALEQFNFDLNSPLRMLLLPASAVAVRALHPACWYRPQAVTPVPETATAPVDMLGGAAAGTPAVDQLGVADFLLLACDGLWDCMSNQQVRWHSSASMLILRG